MDRYEALLLVDRDLGDDLGWHLHPEVLDVAGWWPDGAPAFHPDPDRGDGRRMLLGVIPKREPEEPDGDWLEDDPSVHLLIDVAVTLNEVLRPRRGTVIADAIEAGSLDAQAAAVRAHVRQQVGPHQEHSVMELALAIIRARAES